MDILLKNLRKSCLKTSKILQHTVLHLVLLSAIQISQAHQEGELQCRSIPWAFRTCGILLFSRHGFYECPDYPHLRKWFYTILFGVVEGERTANQRQPLPAPGLRLHLPLTSFTATSVEWKCHSFGGHGVSQISEIIKIILKNYSYIKSNNQWRGLIFGNGSYQ